MVFYNTVKVQRIGALTSKPYAFMARSWELKIYESIDIFDNLGSNIRFDINNLKILRILPKINKTLNENWITDKVRFSYDGLQKQRLNNPLIRKNSILIPETWPVTFRWLQNFFSHNSFKTNKNFHPSINAYCGDLVDLETLYIFKEFLNKSGNLIFKNNNFNNFNSLNFRQAYVCTLKANTLKFYKTLFLINLNIRLENPILNLKIRKIIYKLSLKIFNLGFSYNLTYSYINLGNNIFSFINFLEGKSLICQNFLMNNKLNYILFGYNLIYRLDYNFFINFFYILTNLFNLFDGNFFIPGANRFSSLELGSKPKNIMYLQKSKFNHLKILFLLDFDDISFFKENYTFIIYQGHHGGFNIHLADFILPGAIPYEKKGLYLNLYGILQESTFVLRADSKIRNDWKIIKALGDVLGIKLFYTKRIHILSKLNYIIPKNYIFNSSSPYINIYFSTKLYNSPILNFFGNYYLTNNILRSSLLMALCALRFNILNFL